MNAKLEAQANITTKNNILTEPRLFRLSNVEDAKKLEELLNSRPDLRVCDELESQLTELIKLRHPKTKYSSEQTQALIVEHLNNIPNEEYGVWVYYAWNNTLVHILERDEFYEVKTNRNQHKITRAESELLSQKIVGVVGLSVGRTIAITMTMEHSYGEIRIADFDVLELSNYNRIRAGLPDLGIKKTVSLAREIAEIDPYVKVTCFHDGLTDENIDSFFSAGGQLDVLVDECDGLDIKILLREKAKALKIPVIMDMNDRGTMDIERFDLEPDRPLLHGYIGHLDSKKLKGLTNEQKIPFIMPMLGETTISTKLKASMLEIEQTLTTWPQLAADVTLGGAVAANVYRRIILDEFRDSGRYFIDMDELICDEDNASNEDSKSFGEASPLSWEECKHIVNEVSVAEPDSTSLLNDQELNAILEAATLAPSGGNAQPWKWVYFGKTLFLFKDQLQSDTLLDFDGNAALVGLGAALENLHLQALSLGYEAIVSTHASDTGALISSIQFAKNDVEVDVLSNYIDKRCTNRGLSPSATIPVTELQSLQELNNSFKGIRLFFVDDESQVDTITEVVASVERIRMMEQRGHHDFLKEIRWTPEENEEKRNGIDIETIELTAGEITGFRLAKDWKVVDQLNKWNGGGAFEGLARKSMHAAGAIGIITLDNKTPEDMLTAGRLLERCWLQATHQKLELQPMAPSCFLFERLTKGQGTGFSEKAKKELTSLRDTLLETLQMEDHPAFIFRLHTADTPKVKSLRKPVSTIFKNFNQT